MPHEHDSRAILPLLKAATWEHAAGAACKRFAPPSLAADLAPPWLAFGYDRPRTFEFLPVVDAARLTLMEADALRNLAARAASWKTHEFDGVEPLRLLVCHDDFFAAERMLDRAFVQRAHDLAGAERLIVAVPRRSLLMAMSSHVSDASLARFASAVALQFGRTDATPVCADVFFAERGVVRSSVSAASLIHPAGDPTRPRVKAGFLRNDDGTVSGAVFAAGTDVEAFERDVTARMLELVARAPTEPGFDGHVALRVLVDGSSSAVVESVERIETRCRAIAEGLPGRPITIVASAVTLDADQLESA